MLVLTFFLLDCILLLIRLVGSIVANFIRAKFIAVTVISFVYVDNVGILLILRLVFKC